MKKLLLARVCSTCRSPLFLLALPLAFLIGLAAGDNPIDGYGIDAIYIWILTGAFLVVIGFSVGREHSDGFKNKIVVGYSKVVLFWFEMLFHMSICVLLSCFFLAGLAVFGWQALASLPAAMLLKQALGFPLLCAGIGAFLTAVLLQFSNTAVSLVACALLGMGMLVLGDYLENVLWRSAVLAERIEGFIQFGGSLLAKGPVLAVLDVLHDLNPFGLMYDYIDTPFRARFAWVSFASDNAYFAQRWALRDRQLLIAPLYSLASILLSGTWGCFLFRRKNFK